MDRAPKVCRLADLVEGLLTEHEMLRAAKAEGRAMGPVTGFAELDVTLGGYLPNGISVLQGPPGVGKTALALQTIASCGCTAVYVSAEMAPTELLRRAISRLTQTKLSRLRDPDLDTMELGDLALDTVNALSHVVLIDARVGIASLRFIERVVNRNRADKQPLLVVVDSLQTWARSTATGHNPVIEYELVTNGIQQLSELASSSKFAMLAVSHRHRAGQEKGGLHASKGSGHVEYLAEALLELTTEGDGRPDAAGARAMKLVVLKNRGGQVGTRIDLNFRGDFQEFSVARKGRRRTCPMS